MKARVATLSAPISNPVEVLKVSGLGALPEITRELERLTADKALVEHDLRETQQQLSELRRGHIDSARAAEVIGDLRLLYEAAKPEERRELMRLVIRRIVYRGPSDSLGFEFFDGGAVNLPREGSKLSNEWLPKRSISRTWKFQKIEPSKARPIPTPPKTSPEIRARQRADEFRRLIDAEGLTRAALARRLGVSRAWVSKVLAIPADRSPFAGSARMS